MRKVILSLLLFYATTAAAQTWYVSGEAGLENYFYRQFFNQVINADLPVGLCAQYISKGNALGYEGNLICSPYGTRVDPYYVSPNFTLVNYCSFNPLFNYQRIRPAIKLGFFYAFCPSDNVLPQSDFGPAVAFNLSFKISKKSFLGLEFSELFGLSSYLIRSDFIYNGFFIAGNPVIGSTNINYATFYIKFVHQI